MVASLSALSASVTDERATLAASGSRPFRLNVRQ
jgi:hypothetical protein